MTRKPANFCWDGRLVSVYTCIPIFVCFAGRLVNTPHVVCIHAIVSPSPRGHGWVATEQKALQAMNEFTLFVDFCLIPSSKTCAFDVPAKNL